MGQAADALFAELETFVLARWPTSDLAHGYSEVTLHAPIWRRVIFPGSIEQRLAHRTALLHSLFGAAERIWVLTAHHDGLPFVRNPSRVASRKQWAAPDWNVQYQYTLQIIECAGAALDCPAIIHARARGTGVTAVIDPRRCCGWEPGFSPVDAFLHAVDLTALEQTMSAFPDALWSGSTG